MSKKKKTNTEEEKKAMAGIINIVLAVVLLACVFTVAVTQCATSDGADRNDSPDYLAKWQSIIGGTTWEVSDSTIDPYSLRMDLRYCTEFKFSDKWTQDSDKNRVYDVFITSRKDGACLVAQGYFTMDSATGGTLMSNERKYRIHFSDMSDQSFDDRTYMMRLTYEGYGYIDSYIKTN